MHNALKAAVISVLVAGAGFAQEQQQQAQGPIVIEPPPPVLVDGPVGSSAPLERSIGISTGVNVGLVEVTVQNGHFYGYAATALGVPLVSSGQIGVGNLGLGYSVQLSHERGSAWYFDLYGQALGGKIDLNGQGGGAIGGIGAGVGIRFLHRSGFTLGFKLPVFGVTMGQPVTASGHFDGATSLGYYYLANVFSQAPLTLGFRF